MGISPRVVTQDVTIAWDGASQRLPRGQVIDVVPGSPLERAIGAGRLVPLPGAEPAITPPPEAASPAVTPRPPLTAPRPAPQARKQAAKDGDDS